MGEPKEGGLPRQEGMPQNVGSNSANVNTNGASMNVDRNSGSSADSTMRFHSSGIGVQTMRPQDPFAEQNRVRAIEQKQRNKKRKKALLIGGLCAIVVVTIVVVLIVIKVTNSNNTAEEVIPEGMEFWSSGRADELKDAAQSLYGTSSKPDTGQDDNGDDSDTDSSENEGDNSETGGDEAEDGSDQTGSGGAQGDLGAVRDYFEQQVNEARNDREIIALTLIEMEFYAENGLPSLVIQTGNTIDISRGAYGQFDLYRALMFDAYTELEQYDEADRYFEMEAPMEMPPEYQATEKEF